MQAHQDGKALLKFQIGPVQDFIAQARSTRDLWSGSYLLSWLIAAGIKALPADATLIFPDPESQPLLRRSLDVSDQQAALTPNLPNVFIAKMPTAEAATTAKEIKEAIEKEWKKIAASVWKNHALCGVKDGLRDRFFAQVERHLSIAFQITPIEGSYAESFKLNGWHLDAVRQTRDFKAWASESGPPGKDSLSGKEEAILGGSDDRSLREKLPEPYKSLFSKHDDQLGAVSVIKRVWHLAYLEPNSELKPEALNIRSMPAIAARTPKLDDEEDAQEKTCGENYIAALAFDGDSIGQWVGGELLENCDDLEMHHTAFSKALSGFALHRVRAIVEKDVDGKDKDSRSIKVPLGQLIYAGGDDVVALVPADAALTVAQKLREAFQEETHSFIGKNGVTPDASVGIAIGHIHSPLQDLIRKAHKAEKRAKKEGPKPAFSVTLMKRSGEISYWTAQWDSGAKQLYDAIFAVMTQVDSEGKKLSSKFPHRLCELLSPYQSAQSGVSKFAPTSGFDVHAIVKKEFLFAAERQGSKAIAGRLLAPLEDYLENQSGDPENVIDSLLNLATTLAFTFRNLPKEPTPAERQTNNI